MAESIEPPARTANATTKLAADRTRLAHERTLMAWIRTATSLITFGFTIYKFFQIEAGAGKQDLAISATEFSVLMIVFGLVSLLMATVQHWRDVNALRAEYPETRRSLAVLLAALISVLGIFALITVLLHH